MIIKKFEEKGYQLIAMKLISPSEDLFILHYDELKEKSFFSGIIKAMTSGPVVAMIWQGKDVIK